MDEGSASDTTAARRWLRALGLHRTELRSWALYDWGNSAFATTIMAAVLPIYYGRVAAGELPANVATAYWGYTASIALLIIALASPVLGAVADYLGAKKRFLATFMGVGVLATASLYFVRQGDWLLASGLFVVGNIGFSGSVVFSDSLLPHIAGEDEIDRVSAAGWAVGYLGGGLLLALNAAMIAAPHLFGLADAGQATRVAFVTVAVWWALFSIPLLRNVPEPARRLDSEEARAAASGTRALLLPARAGFRRLAATLGEVRKYADLAKFLVAFWLYADGIGTIIKMATIYGTELGIGQNALIGALLLVQFVGIPFTFLFGALADRIGAKNGIHLTLIVYTFIAIGGYFVQEAWHFWSLAFAVGLVQGGAQALSRSLYASIVPRTKSSEFFAFYTVFSKFAGIMGPFLFGLVSQITGTGRLGILALVIFFVGGMALLARVDVDEGRRAARAEDAARMRDPGGTPLAL